MKDTGMSDTGNRMYCNLWRAIKLGYLMQMIRYCNAFGWHDFFIDTFGWFSYGRKHPKANKEKKK